MNPNDIAPLIIGVFFIVSTSAVILLRPIFKRLGTFLEVLAEERRRSLTPARTDQSDLARLTAALDNIDQRLTRIEDRQEFTDKLLAERDPARLKN